MRLDWRQELPTGLASRLDGTIPNDYRAGWEAARAAFGARIYFYAPSLKRYETSAFRNSSQPNFIPVSITGRNCKLKCDHCRAKILETMHSADSPEELVELGRRLRRLGGEGLLVSGGSLEDGSVPLLPYVDALRELRCMGLKVAVHTGLVDEALADGLAAAGVDIAMIDIVGDGDTIRRVYHLKADVADFERSLRLLTERGISTAPHVVIGLHFGEIRGELRALDIIARYPVASLVLVALVSNKGTGMEAVEPPSPDALGEMFVRARTMFPATPVLLGCARPYGDHKALTDALALKAGLNGIAYPAEGIVELAVELGLKPVFSQQCCSLIYQEERKARAGERALR